MFDEPSLVGRPTDYSQELADYICGELAIGKSLRSVCREEWTPALSTVFKWLRTHKEFSDQYAKAKEESADAHSEEILDIADNATNDYMEAVDDEGAVAYRLNGENIQRSRLRVDTRKWLASKLKPKKYGEKIQQEVTGKDGGAIEIASLTEEQIKARLVAIGTQFPDIKKALTE